MPTIGNMPTADLPVHIFDPAEGIDVKINVNMIVLLSHTLMAEEKAQLGWCRAQNMPTIKVLREKYHLDYYFNGPVRTWKDCAAVLRHLYTLCDTHIKAHSG